MNGGNDTSGNNDLPLLTSELQGGSYSISGTVSVEYRTDFVDGDFKSVPTLKFDNIAPPSAPGPFLYLTRRSLEESRGTGPIENEDLYIPIDEASDGSFTVRGTFFQDLDELMDVETIDEFRNGSWIVWCGPFSVYLGGGQINVVES